METLYVRNLNEKIGLTALKSDLLGKFGEFGEVLDIVARKTLRTKGQAFVVFADPSQADAARQALDGTELYGKLIEINFAKVKSDAIVKRECGAVAVEERSKARKESKLHQQLKRPANEPAPQPNAKKTKLMGQPHNTLFIQGLPPSSTLEQLNSIYQDIPGFVEARLFAARNVGFIEFFTVEDATKAIGIPVFIDGSHATVSYAKQ